MNALRARLALVTDRREGGLSLIEVVVAMFIFALVVSGALYTMLSIVQVTRDSRTRQVAANLAAEEIDLARDSADIFNLLDGDRDVTLNNDIFHVARTTSWVSSPDDDLQCGTGGGQLRYKRVAVTVDWDGRKKGSEPVSTFTVIDPKERINDPSLGTILVSVLNGAGTGSEGVKVEAKPLVGDPNGASPLAEQPRATDIQGCTYVLRVRPGNYTVSVTRTNYLDQNQNTTSSIVAPVTKASAVSVGFRYDLAGEFDLVYAPAADAVTSMSLNMQTTYLSTLPQYVDTVPNTARARTVKLHPLEAGYQIFAGKYVGPYTKNNVNYTGCETPNPAAWQPIKKSGDTYVAPTIPFSAAAPGDDVAVNVDMGVASVDVSVLGVLTGTYLRAESATPPPGTDAPKCDAARDGVSYVFAASNLYSVGGKVKLALPYGSWKIFRGNAASQTTQVTNGIAPVTNGRLDANIVTLDPRTVKVND